MQVLPFSYTLLSPSTGNCHRPRSIREPRCCSAHTLSKARFQEPRRRWYAAPVPVGLASLPGRHIEVPGVPSSAPGPRQPLEGLHTKAQPLQPDSKGKQQNPSACSLPTSSFSSSPYSRGNVTRPAAPGRPFTTRSNPAIWCSSGPAPIQPGGRRSSWSARSAKTAASWARSCARTAADTARPGTATRRRRWPASDALRSLSLGPQLEAGRMIPAWSASRACNGASPWGGRSGRTGRPGQGEGCWQSQAARNFAARFTLYSLSELNSQAPMRTPLPGARPDNEYHAAHCRSP